MSARSLRLLVAAGLAHVAQVARPFGMRIRIRSTGVASAATIKTVTGVIALLARITISAISAATPRRLEEPRTAVTPMSLKKATSQPPSLHQRVLTGFGFPWGVYTIAFFSVYVYRVVV